MVMLKEENQQIPQGEMPQNNQPLPAVLISPSILFLGAVV